MYVVSQTNKVFVLCYRGFAEIPCISCGALADEEMNHFLVRVEGIQKNIVVIETTLIGEARR